MMTEEEIREYKKLAKRQFASETIIDPKSLSSIGCCYECLTLDMVLGKEVGRLDYLRKTFGNMNDEQEKLLFAKAKESGQK